jgi:hypothetical protein
VACALAGALAARALASATESSIMMDDNELIYVSPTHAAQELEQMASLGVEQVKVSMVWALVAPDANSTKKPSFDATNPAAYPPGAWDRYDTVVRIATELGMSVYFQLTAPPPRWSVALHPRNQPYHWLPGVQEPNPQEFGQFTEAVGRRYSGSYVAAPPPGDPPSYLLSIPIGGIAPIPGLLNTTQPQSSTPSALPRVGMWGIWNEPNEGSWLNPQYTVLPHHRTQLVAPLLYRGLVDNAYSGLAASGHAGDTIMIGETASAGITRPLPFVRGLYCVNGRNQPLRGSAAAALGCPTNGSRSAFVAEHPGLFEISGYAHHPYSFDQPPNRQFFIPDSITLYNLGLLERELNTVFSLDGKGRRGGVPIYLTEYGYKSNPPNPYIHTSLTQQATWLNQGEYMSWQYPYVRSLAQFELVDAPPDTSSPKGSREYWSTFQSGLIMLNGTEKPSYDAYRLPIWVPRARHGRRVTVWGQLRPANHRTLQYAVIEFEPHGSSTWQQAALVQTGNPQGFLVSHVSIPSSGRLRLAWLTPAGTVEYSRTVAIG